MSSLTYPKGVKEKKMIIIKNNNYNNDNIK